MTGNRTPPPLAIKGPMAQLVGLEQLDLDLDAMTSVGAALTLITLGSDTDDIARMIGRAEVLLDNGGTRDLHNAVVALSRQATRAEIGKQIAVTLAAFPRASELDESFGKIMAHDVAAQEPSIGALSRACRKIRRTHKFIPSLAEVLEELTAEERRLASLPGWIDRLPVLLDEARRHHQSTVAWREWALRTVGVR